MTNESVRKNKIEDEEMISLKEMILNIKEWWQYLWTKKWLIILAGIIGGLLGLGYAYTKKPIYTATTTFVLESGEKGGGMSQYAGIASMVGIDLGGGGGGGIFQGDNILELYKSRTMLEKTLLTKALINNHSQTLIERFIELNKIKERWKDKPELLALRFDISSQKQSRLRDSVLGETVNFIRDNYLVATRPDKKLNLIKVQINSPDEVFSKMYNDQLVNNVNQFYVFTKTKKALDNVNILAKNTDSIRAVMNGSIYTAAAITDATPNLNPTRQVQRTAPLQKSQFAAEANKEMLKVLIQNLEMAKMSLMKDTPLIQVIDQSVFPLAVVKTSKLKSLIVTGVIFGFLMLSVLVVKRLLGSVS